MWNSEMESTTQTILEELLSWLIVRRGRSAHYLYNVLPLHMMRLGQEVLRVVQIHMFPGENFAWEAGFLATVGTVPAFMVGFSSGAILFGIVPGVIMGLGLMFAFRHCQKQRSRARRLKAGYIIALSSMTLDDYHRIFSKTLFPSWVVFSEPEKVNWLNRQLEKVWPFFNEAYSKRLMEIWEPYLDFYKPTLASSVSFQKLTLGTVAPQFKGVQMLDLAKDEISMDAEAQWEGNSSCIFSVATVMGVSLPVQVKDISMTLIFRLIFKPLVEELPGFGALTYSIRKKKKFDFTLKFIGGDIRTVPGLAETLHDMITTAVIDSLCWPIRVVLPVIPNPVDGDYSRLQRHMCPRRNGMIFRQRLLEMPPVGIIDIKLVQARDLRQYNTVKNPDPFAMIYIHATPGRLKRSTTIRNEGNPIWNQLFELEVEDPDEQKLVIFLLDEGAAQEFQVLGCTQFYLQALEPGTIAERWLRLVKNLEEYDHVQDTKYRGQVNIEMVYRRYEDEEARLNRASLASIFDGSTFGVSVLEKRRSNTTPPLSHKFSRKGKMWERVRGVLSVTVVRAENLLSTDFNGKGDPYAVVQMSKTLHEKNKTMVMHKNLNPEWNQTFHFTVEDAMHDMLIVEVWDQDTFGKEFMGMVAMSLTRVLSEGEFDEVFQLIGVPIGRLFLRLVWTHKPIFTNPLTMSLF